MVPLSRSNHSCERKPQGREFVRRYISLLSAILFLITSRALLGQQATLQSDQGLQQKLPKVSFPSTHWKEGFPVNLLYLDAVFVDLEWENEKVEAITNLLHRIEREIEEERLAYMSRHEKDPYIVRQKAFWRFQGLISGKKAMLLKKYQSEVDLLVTEEDRQRLDEIVLQRAGTMSILRDDRVKKLLGIGVEQSERITEIYFKHYPLVYPKRQPLKDGALIMETYSESSEAKARDSELLEALTSEQRILYRKTVGRRFDESACFESIVLNGVRYKSIGLTFNKSGTLLAASRSGDVTVMDALTGEVMNSWNAHRGDITSLLFHRGFLVSSSTDRTVKSWGVNDGKELRSDFTVKPRSNAIRYMAMNQSGDRLAVVSGGGVFLSDDRFYRQHSSQKEVTCVAFRIGSSHRREREIEYGQSDGTFGVLGDKLRSHRGPVLGIVFEPTGKWLASAGADGIIRISDAKTGECLREWQAHSCAIRKIDLNGEGNLLASSSEDGTIKLWRVDSGTEEFGWVHARGGPATVAFHPTGQSLASAGEDSIIRIWDVRTGKLLREFAW
jgi:WD domain, G-beta repeat